MPEAWAALAGAGSRARSSDASQGAPDEQWSGSDFEGEATGRTRSPVGLFWLPPALPGALPACPDWTCSSTALR